MPLSLKPDRSGPQDEAANLRTARELIARILVAAEHLPERACDFAVSVDERVRDFSTTIEAKQRATKAQIEALENIELGVSRWFCEREWEGY